MNRGTIKIVPSQTNDIRVSITLSDDGTVWMSVEEIASTFGLLAVNVQRQIKRLLATGGLYEEMVRREQAKTLHTGRRYIAEYYNLDMIIALCFALNSYPCIAFRQWVGSQLVQVLKAKSMTPLILQIQTGGHIAN